MSQTSALNLWCMPYNKNDPNYKEKVAANAARYRARHLERVKDQQKGWYEENRERSIAKNREWKAKNPDVDFNSYLKRKYGITREHYDRLLVEQDGRCAICKGPPVGRVKSGIATRFDVDHCHRSGIVRGLLCHPCNTMLGQARDRTSTLEAAILYLKKADNDSFSTHQGVHLPDQDDRSTGTAEPVGRPGAVG